MSTKTVEILANTRIFSGLSKAELKKIDGLMTGLTIKAGKEFISEGTPGRQAFVIIEGTATVRRGASVVATVGPGDILGEMSVIAGLPTVASVRADTDLEVEVLTSRELSSLLDEVPRISKKIMVGVLTRLHELEPGLIR